MQNIFDTHSHYNLDPLYENWQEHWKKAQKKGVSSSIVVGTNIETSLKGLEIAKNESQLHATFGIHPADASLQKKDISDLLETMNLELTTKKYIAVGEIGLDYYRLKDDSTKQKIVDAQKEALIEQLKLAQKHSLPVILHVRDKHAPPKKEKNNAYWDTISILEKHYDFKKPAVLHCVSGSLSYALHALDIGAYFGFDGNITYPNSKVIHELISLTPFHKILVETDAPYLPPQEYRGKTCEPWMISITSKYIQEKYGITSEELTQNAQAFFGLG